MNVKNTNRRADFRSMDHILVTGQSKTEDTSKIDYGKWVNNIIR